MNKIDKTKPMKSMEMIDQILGELNMLKADSRKFDKGNDLAGQRLRKNLNTVCDKIEHLRREIQRTRYYRDAWGVYFGQKKYIDGLGYKEKRYGTVVEVTQLQLKQRWKA